MAFQIKNAVSITASMINRIKASTTKISDFHVGSIVRTMVEAVATEIDQLYQQMFNGIREAIPVAVYNTFNFTRLSDIAASGTITVNITSTTVATVVPAGTVFSYTGGQVTYVSAADATIPAHSTAVDILCVASATGSVGNIPAGVAFTPSVVITGFVSAANGRAFINGREQETDSQRKARFAQYVRALARSNVAGLLFGAATSFLSDDAGMITEQVQTASVIEPWLTDNTQPPGLVNVYIHNGVGSTSDGLVTQTNNVLYGYTDDTGTKIPGYKAAGAKVVVNKATETTIDVTGTITPLGVLDESELAAQASVAISNYLLGLGIGETAQFSQMVFIVRNLPGVANYVQSAPTADVTANDTHKLMPGTITIT